MPGCKGAQSVMESAQQQLEKEGITSTADLADIDPEENPELYGKVKEIFEDSLTAGKGLNDYNTVQRAEATINNLEGMSDAEQEKVINSNADWDSLDDVKEAVRNWGTEKKELYAQKTEINERLQNDEINAAEAAKLSEELAKKINEKGADPVSESMGDEWFTANTKGGLVMGTLTSEKVQNYKDNSDKYQSAFNDFLMSKAKASEFDIKTKEDFFNTREENPEFNDLAKDWAKQWRKNNSEELKENKARVQLFGSPQKRAQGRKRMETVRQNIQAGTQSKSLSDRYKEISGKKKISDDVANKLNAAGLMSAKISNSIKSLKDLEKGTAAYDKEKSQIIASAKGLKTMDDKVLGEGVAFSDDIKKDLSDAGIDLEE